jgi:alpha/beta hydrolase family protein
VNADLVLIHGFWSSQATWDRLITRLESDPDLAGLRIHAFPYESPKLRWPLSRARIPDYNDIGQSLPSYLKTVAPGTTPIAIVTHSQGGLILQRFLAWMLTEGRGRELARIRLVMMLSCPNEGSGYARSIRAVVGLRHHPQAGQLEVLDHEVGAARGIVLHQVVHATTIDARNCRIPVYVYSGRTDNIVRRESAHSVFPNAEVLPGDHFSILEPDTLGHLTVPTIKSRLLANLIPVSLGVDSSATERPPFEPRALSYVYAQGPDGRRFEFRSVLNTKRVKEISSSVLDEYDNLYFKDGDHRPPRAIVSLVRADGKYVRLDSDNSLEEAGINDASLLLIEVEADDGQRPTYTILIRDARLQYVLSRQSSNYGPIKILNYGGCRIG